MESIRPPTRDIKISNIFKNTSLSVATKPPVNKRTTTQLAIVKWLNKRRAVGNLGSTAHSNRSSSALSTLVATAPTFLTDASMHKVPTKGLLNSYRHCNQPLQKSPGSKICSFQEVFVGDSCQQPKVVLHRSELCLCYLRALANPQAASFTELNILHLRTTSSRASGQIGSSIVWTTITFHVTRFSPTVDSLTGPAVACQACQHSGDMARLKFHRGNPTPQLAIVKWLNKRRAVGTHHTGTTTGFLSSLWSPDLPQQSWHLAAASSVVFSPWWHKPKLFCSIHAGGYSAYLSHRRFNAQSSHERTSEFLSAL